MIRWKWNYALLALFTLLLEIAIEHFFKGGFIRYFIGDFFIVWLLFYSLRTIINLDPRKIIFAVILFSFTIEFLQLAQFPARMGWESSVSYRPWKLIRPSGFGSLFAWRSMCLFDGFEMQLCASPNIKNIFKIELPSRKYHLPAPYHYDGLEWTICG